MKSSEPLNVLWTENGIKNIIAGLGSSGKSQTKSKMLYSKDIKSVQCQLHSPQESSRRPLHPHDPVGLPFLMWGIDYMIMWLRCGNPGRIHQYILS